MAVPRHEIEVLSVFGASEGRRQRYDRGLRVVHERIADRVPQSLAHSSSEFAVIFLVFHFGST